MVLSIPCGSQPKGTSAKDTLSFTRPNWFAPVMDECRRVREAAGLYEFTGMAKFMVEGEGAEGWLNHILANRVPTRAGRMTLSPMLSDSGRLAGDFTVSRLSDESFLLLGSDPMQLAYTRRFRADPPPAGVSLRNASGDFAGLHLAGPAAREVLHRIAEADLSSAAFPFLGARRMTIAGVPDVIVLRVSYTGELGYELYCAPAGQPVLFDALMREGASLGLGLVGTRSLMMLRLEKSFSAWGLELTPDYTPFEAGLERFVAFAKPDFVGREAALARPAERTARSPVHLHRRCRRCRCLGR